LARRLSWKGQLRSGSLSPKGAEEEIEMKFFDSVLQVADDTRLEQMEDEARISLVPAGQIRSDDMPSEQAPMYSFQVTIKIIQAIDLPKMEIIGKCSPFFHPCVRARTDDNTRFWLDKSNILKDCVTVPLWNYEQTFTSAEKSITVPVSNLFVDIYFWDHAAASDGKDEKLGKVHFSLVNTFKTDDHKSSDFYPIINDDNEHMGQAEIEACIEEVPV